MFFSQELYDAFSMMLSKPPMVSVLRVNTLKLHIEEAKRKLEVLFKRYAFWGFYITVVDSSCNTYVRLPLLGKFPHCKEIWPFGGKRKDVREEKFEMSNKK